MARCRESMKTKQSVNAGSETANWMGAYHISKDGFSYSPSILGHSLVAVSIKALKMIAVHRNGAALATDVPEIRGEC
jgi:hypothetical protein